MTKELVSRLNAEQCERLHAAYTTIACIYEDVCGGPYKAREHKEYFAVMDTREHLRQRFMQLTAYGNGQQ